MATQREIASRANIAHDDKKPGRQFPPLADQLKKITREKANQASEPENEEQRSKPDFTP